jgi:hypothetical protein
MEITSSYGPVNFRMIPHGLVDVPEVHYDLFNHRETPTIGSAGFAFPSKRFDVVVKAARDLGGRSYLITPSHPSFDPRPMWEELKKIGGNSLLIEEAFMPQSQVVRLLATCSILVYCADEPLGPGQSGSVRMMAAARRPMVVRRCKKVETLYEYDDEIYFVDTFTAVEQTIASVWTLLKLGGPVKLPNRMLKDLSFETTGKMFADLIEELTVKAVSA